MTESTGCGLQGGSDDMTESTREGRRKKGKGSYVSVHLHRDYGRIDGGMDSGMDGGGAMGRVHSRFTQKRTK